MNITKVIIPAAGLGTRFLPFTKAIPKEMLPLGNLPAIHYILEEIVESGINEVIIIVSPYKQAIKDYLSITSGVTDQVHANGKTHLLDSINRLLKKLTITYVEQKVARGLGDALLQAQAHCTEDFFGLLLPDDIILTTHGQKPALLQLLEKTKLQKKSVLAVQKLPRAQISAYGCVAVSPTNDASLFKINHVVEKPTIEEAPSDLAIIGRYVLSTKIFDYLKRISAQPTGQEIQLTDALLDLVINNDQLFAYEFQGERFDLGTPVGWLAANNRIIEFVK